MERDVRIQTDAMMERGMYEGHSVADASAATANQSRRTSGFKSRKGLSRQDSHVDDTHTGGQDHVATSDFLRVMRMLMFLSPNGGWASREGSDCIRRNRRNQKKQPEQYVGWRPRSELDISGHSFRRVIKVSCHEAKHMDFRGKSLGDIWSRVSHQSEKYERRSSALPLPTILSSFQRSYTVF